MKTLFALSLTAFLALPALAADEGRVETTALTADELGDFLGISSWRVTPPADRMVASVHVEIYRNGKLDTTQGDECALNSGEQLLIALRAESEIGKMMLAQPGRRQLFEILWPTEWKTAQYTMDFHTTPAPDGALQTLTFTDARGPEGKPQEIGQLVLRLKFQKEKSPDPKNSTAPAPKK